MPPMPPHSAAATSCRPCPPFRRHTARHPPPRPSPFSSGLSATIASVVSSREATLAAFWSAVRTTLVGSMTPALIRSSYSSVWALNPVASLGVLDLVDHDRAVDARVLRDASQRLFDGTADDVDARVLLSVEPSRVSRPSGREAAPRRRPARSLFDRRTRGVECVFDASLLLLHLGLGGRTDLDDRDAADQLRESLLELLAIVVGGRSLRPGCGSRSSDPRCPSWCPRRR